MLQGNKVFIFNVWINNYSNTIVSFTSFWYNIKMIYKVHFRMIKSNHRGFCIWISRAIRCRNCWIILILHMSFTVSGIGLWCIRALFLLFTSVSVCSISTEESVSIRTCHSFIKLKNREFAFNKFITFFKLLCFFNGLFTPIINLNVKFMIWCAFDCGTIITNHLYKFLINTSFANNGITKFKSIPHRYIFIFKRWNILITVVSKDDSFWSDTQVATSNSSQILLITLSISGIFIEHIRCSSFNLWVNNSVPQFSGGDSPFTLLFGFALKIEGIKVIAPCISESLAFIWTEEGPTFIFKHTFHKDIGNP